MSLATQLLLKAQFVVVSGLSSDICHAVTVAVT